MRICFVTPRFPYPPNKGDKLRAYYQIRELAKRGHSITLVSLVDDALGDAARVEMARWCKRVETIALDKPRAFLRLAALGLFSHAPLQTLFYESDAMRERLTRVLGEGRFDVVHATLGRMAPYVWSIDPPVVIDLTDAMSLSMQSRLDFVNPVERMLYRFEMGKARAEETRNCAHFSRLVVCAGADKEHLGSDHVAVIRNAVDLARFSFLTGGRDAETIVMTGNMGYQPNVDAAVWFTKEILPLVAARRPNVKVRFVGARPNARVKALANDSRVTVTGPVDDLAAELHRATIAICPMRCGAGIQNKVLEAMATGTPVVSTSIGNRGVGAQPREMLEIADQPGDFAAAVIQLLDDSEQRSRLANRAHAFMRAEFTWEHHVDLLLNAYRDAIEMKSAGYV